MILKVWTRLAIVATFLILVSGIVCAAETPNGGGSLSGKTIVIDPGHMSTEKDRINSGEYEITHKIGPILKDLLTKDGATVYLTDTAGDKIEPSIGTRANFAISKNPIMFISIHTNAAVSTARGVEVWLWGANDKSGFRERELAESIYESVIKQTELPSTRGIREKNNPWPNGVPILTYAYPCPAVLVELDFTTYSLPVVFNGKTYTNMRQLMLSPEYQNNAAEALHSAVYSYFKINPQPTNPLPHINNIDPPQTKAGDFVLTINGNNFDQNNVVDMIYKTDGVTPVGSGTVTSRSSSKLVVTEHMTGAPAIVYVVKVRNKYTDPNTESNGVNLQITAAPVTSPVTLTVSPLSGRQGTTFTFSGNGYTHNEAIEYHVRKPDNTEYPVTTLTASNSGVLSYSYRSTTASPVGTYTIWAIDKKTGRQSNNVQETIDRTSRHLK